MYLKLHTISSLRSCPNKVGFIVQICTFQRKNTNPEFILIEAECGQDRVQYKLAD